MGEKKGRWAGVFASRQTDRSADKKRRTTGTPYGCVSNLTPEHERSGQQLFCEKQFLPPIEFTSAAPERYRVANSFSAKSSSCHQLNLPFWRPNITEWPTAFLRKAVLATN
jgi:hypothetical protein